MLCFLRQFSWCSAFLNVVRVPTHELYTRLAFLNDCDGNDDYVECCCIPGWKLRA